MRLFRKERNDERCRTTYIKICECCGRKFKAIYRIDDYYAYVTAKDMVNSHYNAHKMLCRCADNVKSCA